LFLVADHHYGEERVECFDSSLVLNPPHIKRLPILEDSFGDIFPNDFVLFPAKTIENSQKFAGSYYKTLGLLMRGESLVSCFIKSMSFEYVKKVTVCCVLANTLVV
jgi:hypothetical protein